MVLRLTKIQAKIYLFIKSLIFMKIHGEFVNFKKDTVRNRMQSDDIDNPDIQVMDLNIRIINIVHCNESRC